MGGVAGAAVAEHITSAPMIAAMTARRRSRIAQMFPRQSPQTGRFLAVGLGRFDSRGGVLAKMNLGRAPQP
jgi:hypothetical protein